ncbi:MAG: MFS transporter, partial [Gemmatimonadota bacterium]
MQTIQDRSGRYWPLVAAAALLLAISTGTRSSMGLFAGPLNTATALGAATIALALALSQLVWGAAQPLLGLLANRIGAARLVACGGLVAAAAFAALTIASDTVSLLLVAIVSGAASAAAGSAPLLMGFVMRRVPQHRIGLALGLVSAGGSAGQLVLALSGAAL